MSIISRKLINKLPVHVIHQKIIPYTYMTQSKELLADIRDFGLSREQVFRVYSTFFRFDEIDEDDDDWKHWILNNLDIFMNRHAPYYTGKYDGENFTDILGRNFILKNETTIKKVKYMNFLEKNTYPGLYENNLLDVVPCEYYWNRSFNFIWGLLTISEREKFIQNSFDESQAETF
tara:strand:- start:30 stop:557 length:528 start_codon:yes stop_codon:yes gene_type:complete